GAGVFPRRARRAAVVPEFGSRRRADARDSDLPRTAARPARRSPARAQQRALIPLRHTLPAKTTPVVNRALVVANAVLFIVQIFLGDRAEMLITVFGFMPMRFLHPHAFGYTPLEVAITLVTSLFLHGGVVHLLGNMVYLWVFGGAVEDSFGRWRYLAFYIACGAIGSLTHTLLFPASTV